MITVETVRAAVESNDPTEKLDQLVRNLLATGKTTAEIYSVMLPTVRAIRKESSLPGDLDEILLGTLDALTGDCNPDECYQDPPAAPASINGKPETARPTPVARGA